MTSIHEFTKRLSELETRKTLPPSNDVPPVSEKVIQLADRFNKWHSLLPLPDKWEEQQLGRLAAKFGVSRELMAEALGYAGWKERRTGATSHWNRYR